jgi:hypothetical protein
VGLGNKSGFSEFLAGIKFRFYSSTVAVICYTNSLNLQHLLPVQPEESFENKIGNTESAQDFLALCPLQIVNLHVQQPPVEFRDLFP